MQIKPPPEKNARRSKRFENNDDSKAEVCFKIFSYKFQLLLHTGFYPYRHLSFLHTFILV